MAKPGRNDPCPCGSGRKYKHCHQAAEGGPAPAIQPNVLATPASGPASLPSATTAAMTEANRGNVLHDQGKLAEAEASFRKALALKPDFAEVHSNLGVTLHAQGKFEAAAGSHRKALALNPDYVAAHFNLGMSLQSLGKLPEAVESYRRAIALSPALVAAHQRLAETLGGMVPLWHVPMMNDAKRNDAYEAALKAAVTPGMHVLEIGTGSGLLSMMAARAGASRVTTCEAEPLIAATARRILADNGLQDRIDVIARRSTEMAVGKDMAEPADLLVSEIFSSELLAEWVVPSVEDAKRRLLKPGARVIPASGSIMVALFGGEAIGANLSVGYSSGFDLRAFNGIVPRRQVVHRSDLGIRMLSEDIEALRVDFDSPEAIQPQSKTLRIPVKSAGRCHGLIQWIRLQMDASTTFENHPKAAAPASGWQNLAYVLPSPVDLVPGQVAVVTATHNRLSTWFSLERFE